MESLFRQEIQRCLMKGSVAGVDIVPEMIVQAERNLQMMKLDNVKFQKVPEMSQEFVDLLASIVNLEKDP